MNTIRDRTQGTMNEHRGVRYIRPSRLKEQYGIDRITAWRWSKDQAKAFPKAIRLAHNVSVYDREAIDAWFAAQEGKNLA